MNFSSTWRYPADAWQWACNTIQGRGDLVKTEDDQLTREVLNLMVTVLEPQSGWPIDADWGMTRLNAYVEKEILSPIIPEGFRYTYGQRLFAYPYYYDEETCLKANQIQHVIEKLRKEPNSRRCIAITWVPDPDSRSSHVPCLQSVDFLFRQGKLNLTAYFRSQDISRAWPANLYGLSRLLAYVAERAGMQPGSITTISASAHIYER